MPEYDPDYVQLANGKVIRVDRSSYLTSGPAVTGKTLEDAQKYNTRMQNVQIYVNKTKPVPPAPKIPWYIRIQMRFRGIR